MTDKPLSTSLYEQIKHFIRSEIGRQAWKPGDLLPSEHELTRRFAVSRITVKKAMSDLVKEGLVYRIQGKGSYVSPMDGKAPAAPSGIDSVPLRSPVALLLPFINNRFNALLLGGVESVLAEAGYPLLFCHTGNSQANEERILRRLKQAPLAGLIVYPVEGETYNRELVQLALDDVPFVVVDRDLRGIDTHFVGADNVAGAREAVGHLISLGHRNIGFVSTVVAGTSSIEDRLAGYEQAHADYRLPIDRRFRLAHLEIEVPKQAELRSFLARNPDMTAVFAINPGLGLEVADAARGLGLRLPQELSLVFFDDFEFSEFHAVRPSCVVQDSRQLGQEAARMLLAVIEQPRRERRKLFLPPHLLLRDSAVPPVRREA
ncbi:GntR family transcriptional regulator [Paenibacillus sp. MWE-103]|uniref:GntR family transcriptional regulator n=1 Tax=Paenibacillus artemisiicola TaxID=1172618 RepID=A0ABS3W3G0_9BACL|nr:GntR family transcriptional regulator [Paenibacillus artemisiicola]MBO7742839.1 GntR family transcriptional regulator [Paenibacillus artemisiicola]